MREDMLDPRKMPHGKLPAIRVGTRIFADSDNIRAYLEENGADFDAGLSDVERAQARAFIRMAEEHLYFHIVLDRWGDDAVWPHIRDFYFSSVPGIMRNFVANGLRKKVLAGLRQQGLGRLSAEERVQRVSKDLDAITTSAWHNKFLFGDSVSSADISVAPMLAAAAVSPGDTALKRAVAENDVLMRYIARVEEACG